MHGGYFQVARALNRRRATRCSPFDVAERAAYIKRMHKFVVRSQLDSIPRKDSAIYDGHPKILQAGGSRLDDMIMHRPQLHW